jgi:rubrerythrin
MKVWKALFARMQSRSAALPDAEYLRGQASLLDQLAAAKREHIQDLRQLLDQARSREDQLSGMVRMVMEERFYRPTVTKDASRPRLVPAIGLENLQDVATFDPEVDQATIEAETKRHRELENEFNSILREENEDRVERGAPPVGA